MIELWRRWLTALQQIDRSGLSGVDAANYDAMRYHVDLSLEGADHFDYGRVGFPTPYLLTQFTGAYKEIPDFLDSQHAIADRDDAEAYLSRLREFATALDDESQQAGVHAGVGVIPPCFVIEKALTQLKALRATPVNETSLIASLGRRTEA